MSHNSKMPYGTVRILDQEALYEAKAEAIRRVLASLGKPGIAFTGGSTPKSWYTWAIASGAFNGIDLNRATWTVSDERHVPVHSPDSNFGHALAFLDPLGVREPQRFPWPTDLPPEEAARRYQEAWEARFGAGAAYSLCILGMGNDGHTASLFPGAPQALADVPQTFTAVEVPGKGWRLTITPAGLSRCAEVLVLVAGAGKADRLKRVLTGPFDPAHQPIQRLGDLASKVTWLVDEEAGSKL